MSLTTLIVAVGEAGHQLPTPPASIDGPPRQPGDLSPYQQAEPSGTILLPLSNQALEWLAHARPRCRCNSNQVAESLCSRVNPTPSCHQRASCISLILFAGIPHMDGVFGRDEPLPEFENEVCPACSRPRQADEAGERPRGSAQYGQGGSST